MISIIISMDIHYHKRKVVNLGDFISKNKDQLQEPYVIDNLQLYNPIYEKLFKLSDTNYNSISLNHKYHIKNSTEVYEVVANKTVDISRNIFVKFSPLLDPVKYMTGKYDINDPNLLVLPSLSSNEDNCHKKTLCVHNASYVDNFFYYLSSVLLNQYKFIHGMDYYGSFLGIQKDFKVNVTDDLEYISSSGFFVKNIGILFSADDLKINNEIRDTKKNKSILNIDNNDTDIDIDFFDLSSTIYEHNDNIRTSSITLCDMSEIYCEDIGDENADILSESSDDNSETNYSEKDDIVDEEEEGSDNNDDEYEGSEYTDTSGSEYTDDDFEDIFAHIKNFPTQMICLEKCESTLDQLLMDESIDDKKSSSILFQIVMTLLVYQKVFNFTHNDLRGNQKKVSTLQFLVKWLNYTEDYNSWEPWANLRLVGPLHKYLRANQMEKLIPSTAKLATRIQSTSNRFQPLKMIPTFNLRLILPESNLLWKVVSAILK
jgi:Chromo (CHRromatin Organisation MOdifier) domain